MDKRNEILDWAKKAFIAAMLSGYASEEGDGVPKIKTTDGYTTITCIEEGFTVVDRYYTMPRSTYSVGTTTIFYKGKPIWLMSYGGSYPKKVISFLKAALTKAYTTGSSVGCRGPQSCEEGDLLYINNCTSASFREMRGYEVIKSIETGRVLGYHEYWGGSLI
ncbi:MAG: hypothetical protein ACD_81C00181G0001 [uncultured bacterium]|uniref:DUF5680 domain-containing protein n=1 Tax=Candidatus Wolfebacteria bacterium GW2011_GWE2_44_13 TaxID=1619017 RepID=A0A0G1HAR2_9BACT|nr:MAG: hypothetical protein ACD_81C00181G0001 [uncultured bacterium]KKT43880.1 MAG: hypothetical protein UW32_C0001G0472 [Candidatus Wolfebacteria bacterium GW2011_GWE2_44_13]